VLAPADDQVVVHGQAERGSSLDDVLGDCDVCLGGGRVARRVVVDQNQGGRPQFERTFNDLAGVDRRMIDGAALLSLVLDQCILAIQEEYVEFLNFAVGNLRTAIVD
jgi:hypothetical protein